MIKTIDSYTLHSQMTRLGVIHSVTGMISSCRSIVCQIMARK
jgi:hypothetical protein